MSEISKTRQTVDTLLAVMSEQLKNLLKSVDSIEKKLDSKVDIVDFIRLEKSLDEHKKENDLKHKETSDKVTAHTVRFSALSGAVALAAWFIK